MIMEKLKEKVLKYIESTQDLLKEYQSKSINAYNSAMLTELRARKKILDSIYREIPNAPRIAEMPKIHFFNGWGEGACHFIKIPKPNTDMKYIKDYSDSPVRNGATYRHYKGGLYKVVMHSIEESTGQTLVTYHPLDGDQVYYTRPLIDFLNYVLTPEGLVHRFTYHESR